MTIDDDETTECIKYLQIVVKAHACILFPPHLDFEIIHTQFFLLTGDELSRSLARLLTRREFPITICLFSLYFYYYFQFFNEIVYSVTERIALFLICSLLFRL
jgi:hypothetical protein